MISKSDSHKDREKGKGKNAKTTVSLKHPLVDRLRKAGFTVTKKVFQWVNKPNGKSGCERLSASLLLGGAYSYVDCLVASQDGTQ